MLLNPSNKDAEKNYLSLLFRTDPIKALVQKSNSSMLSKDALEQDILLRKCLSLLREENFESEEIKIVASIAIGLIEKLEDRETWRKSPENALLICELLAEIGYTDLALKKVKKIIEKNSNFADAIFLATKLVVHLKDRVTARPISRQLAALSSQRSELGIKAIRHMSLLYLLEPLNKEALNRCIELLDSNPNSKAIDYLRILALLYSDSDDQITRRKIINRGASMFNLSDRRELLTFSNWLAQLKAFQFLLHFLPASKAKVDEDLFKLRMSALAQIGDLERLGQEVNDAPIIPLVWRLVIEARSLSLSGNFDGARKNMDRLLPLIDEDPRKVRSVSHYLETVGDLTSLSHLLEKLIERPIHQKFALDKLFQYRSASANLNDLLLWLSKLKEMRKRQPELENAYLYFRLLDEGVFASSPHMNQLLNQAQENYKSQPNIHTQITLALAYLRNQDVSNALVALGEPSQWRRWATEGDAWSLIASKIYYLNHDTEKGDILLKKVDFSRMDKAESESLQKLFPQLALPNKE